MWSELSTSIFNDPDFYDSWTSSRLGSAEYLIVKSGHKAAFILPLHYTRHLGFRIATPAVDDHFPEVPLLLSNSKEREAALRYAARILGKERACASLCLKRQPERLEFDSADSLIRAAETTKIIRTEQDWPEYVAARSKRFRQEARLLERLSQDPKNTIQVITDQESFLKTLPELQKLSEESWQGQNGTGTFSNPTVSTFYTDLAHRLFLRGQLRISILRHENRAIGFLYCTLGNNGRIEALKSEFAPDAAALKPGGLLFRELIQFAHRSGFKEINTGVHFTEFKRRWSTDMPQLWKIEIPTGKVSSHVRRLALQLADRIKRKAAPSAV